jgi:antirestriction protein ArdC
VVGDDQDAVADRHGGGQACYSPPLDYVQLPRPEAFDTPEA